jgi:2,3-bisphosphoglycerate-independent phosphoglycerate mutase
MVLYLDLVLIFTIDDDTIFLFNYRSDRMREISTILGQLDKPIEVDIPKNLVSSVASATQ